VNHSTEDTFAEEFRVGDGQNSQAFGPVVPPSPPVDDSPSASAEKLHWLNTGSREEKFRNALKSVPLFLQKVCASVAQAWTVEPSSVLITLLHSISAALGRTHRLRLGHLGISCPFNLLSCSDRVSNCNYYEYLSEPWLSRARGRLRMHQSMGTRQLMSEIRQLLAVHEQNRKNRGESDPPPLFNYEQQVASTYQQLRPCITVRSCRPKDVLLALESSADQCVLCLGDGSDIVQQLLELPRQQARDLARILRMSWRDFDLPVKGAIPCRGVVHFYWQSTRVPTAKLILGNKSPWQNGAPPFLLVRDSFPPQYLSVFNEEAFELWKVILTSAYNGRDRSTPVKVWELSPEASGILEAFLKQLYSQADSLRPFDAADFHFFQELALRISVLCSYFNIFDGSSSADSSGHITSTAMERACTICLWMAQEHYECLVWLRESELDPQTRPATAGQT